MPDLRFGDAEPTDEERIAVDEVVADLGSVVVVEGERLVYAGHARTTERRHLLLPALHAVQRASGWISPGGLDYACRQLDFEGTVGVCIMPLVHPHHAMESTIFGVRATVRGGQHNACWRWLSAFVENSASYCAGFSSRMP